MKKKTMVWEGITIYEYCDEPGTAGKEVGEIIDEGSSRADTQGTGLARMFDDLFEGNWSDWNEKKKVRITIEDITQKKEVVWTKKDKK